jgi:hypothetical protein
MRFPNGDRVKPACSAVLLLLSLAAPAAGQQTRFALNAEARAYAGYFDQNTIAGTSGITTTSWLMLNAGYGSEQSSVGLHTMFSGDPVVNGECGQPRLLPERLDCGDAESVSHPFVMALELNAQTIVAGTRLQFTGGAVGEPAYGPKPHFMRASAAYDPGEPLTHHFFSPAHSAHGVVTVGASGGSSTLEVSAFNGAHVDDHFRIDLGPLDARAARFTFRPHTQHQVQLSAAWFPPVEGGHHAHGGSMRAYSMTASGTVNGMLDYTAGCAAHRVAHETPFACLVEGTLQRGPHVFFARAEGTQRLEQTEETLILEDGSHAHLTRTYLLNTGELALGYGIRLPSVLGVRTSVGARGALTSIPSYFDIRYGERRAASFTVFVSARPAAKSHHH